MKFQVRVSCSEGCDQLVQMAPNTGDIPIIIRKDDGSLVARLEENEPTRTDAEIMAFFIQCSHLFPCTMHGQPLTSAVEEVQDGQG